MKVHPETLKRLREKVEPVALAMGADGSIVSAYRRARLTHERYRRDALHASGFDVPTLYAEGLSDSHIDTALRSFLGSDYSEPPTLWPEHMQHPATR